MVKHITLATVTFLLFSIGFVWTVNAQSDSEKIAKRTEKFRQKVKSLGTGEKVKIVVNLFDGNIHKGYISESNDQSFIVVDKTGNSKTIKYGDVKNISKQGKTSNLVTGVVIGAVAGVAVTILIIFKSLGG